MDYYIFCNKKEIFFVESYSFLVICHSLWNCTVNLKRTFFAFKSVFNNVFLSLKQVFENILSHKPAFNGSRICVHIWEQHIRRGCFNCYFCTLSKYSIRVLSWNSCFLWKTWISKKCYLKIAPSPVVVLPTLCRCFKYINFTEWMLFLNHFVNDLVRSKCFKWILAFF